MNLDVHNKTHDSASSSDYLYKNMERESYTELLVTNQFSSGVRSRTSHSYFKIYSYIVNYIRFLITAFPRIRIGDDIA